MTVRKLILGAAAALLAGGGLAGCGKIGPLDQPAPLFGDAARRDYYAQRAARDHVVAQQNAAASQNSTGSAEREANSLDDDAPRTTRDIRDPTSQLTTPRNDPVPGEPNPLGPTISTTPPN